MPEAKEETDEGFTIGDEDIGFPFESLESGIKIFIFLIGFGFLGFIYMDNVLLGIYTTPALLFRYLIESVVFGFFILVIIYMSKISDSVTVDKKSQSVVIRKNSIIRYLKPIKEIPFSDIERIMIKDNSSLEPIIDSWSVNISTIQGGYIKIYKTGDESGAKEVAEKIQEITGKEISYPK